MCLNGVIRKQIETKVRVGERTDKIIVGGN